MLFRHFLISLFCIFAVFARAETAETLTIQGDFASESLLNELVARYESETGTDVRVTIRPGGIIRETQIRQQLATGHMDDVFYYNVGALMHVLDLPNFAEPIEDLAIYDRLHPLFIEAASVDSTLYAVPFGGAMVGGAFYNREIYAQLGLEVPSRWSEFVANAQAVKVEGILPIAFSFATTWSTQVLILADYHNLESHYSSFAREYTSGELGFRDIDKFHNGFFKLEQLAEKGLLAAQPETMTIEQAVEAVANEEAAHVIALSYVVANTLKETPDALDKIGFFPIPDDIIVDNPGTTIWVPSGLFVNKTAKNKEAALDFVDFVTRPSNCDILLKFGAVALTMQECALGASDSKLFQDIHAYAASSRSRVALEFLSPLKGPSLEAITGDLAAGEISFEEAVRAYDADLRKRALELELTGWR